jgi:ParB family chromosome partitioning protein
MSAFDKRRGGLGRGLSSLIPPPSESKNLQSKSLEKNEGNAQKKIAIEDLLPGDGQPRKVFNEGPLEELAQSIKNTGILQPILVRRRKDGQYEIVAGERRWRAAQKAGLKEVPCTVADLADEQVLTTALIENLQREDLNPIEEAEAYRRLSDEQGLSQDKIAKAVGKDRSTVANALRLLKLPEKVREMVQGGALTMGHARALLGLEKGKSMEKMARKVVNEGLSVRKTELMVRAKRDQVQEGRDTSSTAKNEPSPAERDLRRRLERLLATRVELNHNKGKGKIVLHFSSYEELDALIERMGA